MSFRADEHWYVNPWTGTKWPSVTTILSLLPKPALVHWYAKEERKACEAALREVLTVSDIAYTADHLWSLIEARLTTVKAAERLKQKAAEIGTQAHALIEWETRRMFGERIGDEPAACDEAINAFLAWVNWMSEHQVRIHRAEFQVHHKEQHYSGTADVLYERDGRLLLGDYKSGKAIYKREAFLQNIAYRAAAKSQAIHTDGGLILRLPKVIGDPIFEAVEVEDWPEAVDDFLALKRAWEINRRLEDRFTMPKAKANSNLVTA